MPAYVDVVLRAYASSQKPYFDYFELLFHLLFIQRKSNLFF